MSKNSEEAYGSFLVWRDEILQRSSVIMNNSKHHYLNIEKVSKRLYTKI